MPRARFLTHTDRAQRQKAIVAAYCTGLTSRAVAARYGLSDGHIRAIVRMYEAARPRGRRCA